MTFKEEDTTITAESSTEESPLSTESEYEEEKNLPVISFVQHSKHSKQSDMLHTRFARIEQSAKYKNFIYVSPSRKYFVYELTTKKRDLPPTRFQIITTQLQLLYCSVDEQVIRLDRDGKYVDHAPLLLKRYGSRWITPDVLVLEFLYETNNKPFIQFQCVVVHEPNWFKIRSSTVLIHYENNPFPLSRCCYSKKIHNWYLFF